VVRQARERAMAVINGTEKSDTLNGTSGNDTITVQSHMQQSGNNVEITTDAGNSITLWNVQMTSLHASDFVFV
jgi:hypothetical protein